MKAETGSDEEAGMVGLADVSTSAGGRAAAAVTYIVTRGGVDEGPYDLKALAAMVKRKQLTSVDTIRDRNTEEPVLVADVPELRDVLQGMIIQEERERRGKPLTKREAAAARAAKRSQRSWLGTALLVLTILGLFAAAGVYLWLRRNG